MVTKRLECEVYVDGIRLEHVSEFKYLGCVLDESIVGRWPMGDWLQVPLGPWLMLGIFNLSVIESCMKHCLHLFLCIAVR